MRRFGVVMAAAGASRRLGRPKQLIEFRGIPLIVHAARTALDSGAQDVVVVTGSSSDAVAEALQELPVRTVFNPQWEEGMGSSIALGVSTLTDVEACVLTLSDQPLITPEHLCSLVEKLLELDSPFVATRYAGSLGVPCAFSTAMFADLRALTGDRGARTLLRNGSDQWSIDFPDAAVDLDTEADVAKLDGA